MSQDLTTHFSEAERAEFERVVGALAKWPRLSHLLQYMGEKLFTGDAEQLNEYNIATNVLGRSKTVFNSGEDAIARVETHRLRKRLAEFYERDGKDNPIQVALPSGSYVPVFIHKPGSGSVPASSDIPAAPGAGDHHEHKRRSFLIGVAWKLALLIVVVLLAIGSYLHFHRAASSTPTNSGPNPSSAAVSMPLPSGIYSSTIHLLSGYSGPPRTDSAGRVWDPDQYFSAGDSWRRDPEFITRTSDPFIFEHSRTGDFSYRIPLKPGSYEVHLFFSTPVRCNEGTFTFNVWINDEWLFQGFDINSDAMGENIADERVFRDISPDKDGVLRIAFSHVTGPSTLNAIEILPGVPHAQLPVRLLMQTTPFTDRRGQHWRPDNYFMYGRLSSQTHTLLDTPEPELFSGERFGHFSYAIPVDTRGTYTLVLHFAEFYFGSGAPGGGGAGNRIFKVMCNGQTLLDNFDIIREAGNLREVTRTFRHLKPSPQGKLNITFEPIVNNATVSGIEVLDESH
jgi:hypothetical protein